MALLDWIQGAISNFQEGGGVPILEDIAQVQDSISPVLEQVQVDQPASQIQDTLRDSLPQ